MENAQILAPNGQPITPANAHRGARLEREIRRWTPRLSSADADLLPDWRLLTARAWDVARNHGMMSGGVQIHLDNIIGTGLRLAAKPEYRTLNQTAEWAGEWSRHVESLWRQWAEDIDLNCDASRRLNFAGMLIQGYRSYMLTGDMLATAEWLPGRGGSYATAIQMVDPARLSNPHELSDADRLRAGVETDVLGAPIAYYIRSSLPSDGRFGSTPHAWRRVPRETPWGRRQVIHVYDQERPGQTRGKSGFASILARTKMLDRFQDAGLEAAVINAMYAAVIESEFDHAAVAQALGVGAEDEAMQNYLVGMTTWHETAPILMDGVKIPHLYPGEKLTMTTPNHPSPNFADFERAVLRHLASGLNISYEELTRDYSQTNYSGARAALEQSWKFFYGRRELIAGAFASQVYALWLEEAIDKGDVEVPDGAPDFWSAKTAWCRCRWVGPRKGHIDPMKESKADLLEMKRGLLTMEDACAARGIDWEENLEEIAQERRRMEELGIDYKALEAAGASGGSAQGGEE